MEYLDYLRELHAGTVLGRQVKPGGFLAVSDLTFTGDSYESAGSFILPESDWQLYYYEVLRRLEPFREKYSGDPGAGAVIKETEEELSFYEKYSGHYSYGFYALRRRGGPLSQSIICPGPPGPGE